MTPISQGHSNGKGRLLFLAAVCLTMGIALFSALAPLGLPFSRATGSAFNPATTSVVLKARSPVEAAAAIVQEPSDGAPTPLPLAVHSWLLPAAMLLLGSRLASSCMPRRYSCAHRHAFALVSVKRARAPPLRS